MRPAILIIATVVLLGSVNTAHATTYTFGGNLGDAGNSALVGSDLGVPGFTDDNAIANNVALYDFSVSTTGTVTIDSTGFAAGGVDPYFTLFQGSIAGAAAATFVDSNYQQAFYGGGGDFNYSAVLAPGSYVVSLGAFANMSFAENYGSGTLGDGFIGLGGPGSLGNGGYALTVTTPVPEPGSWALMGMGVATIFLSKRRTRLTC